VKYEFELNILRAKEFICVQRENESSFYELKYIY
jgi:hypothetical protein